MLLHSASTLLGDSQHPARSQAMSRDGHAAATATCHLRPPVRHPPTHTHTWLPAQLRTCLQDPRPETAVAGGPRKQALPRQGLVASRSQPRPCWSARGLRAPRCCHFALKPQEACGCKGQSDWMVTETPTDDLEKEKDSRGPGAGGKWLQKPGGLQGGGGREWPGPNPCSWTVRRRDPTTARSATRLVCRAKVMAWL